MTKKLCILTVNPFWREPLGCGTLVRNRYRVFKKIFDEVHVLYFTKNQEDKCPLPGVTAAFSKLGRKELASLQGFLNKQKYDVLYSSYNRFWEVVRGCPGQKVVEIHDVVHLRQEAFAAFGYEAPMKSSKDEEIGALGRYDAVIAINRDEAGYLKQNGLGNVHHLPPNFQAIARPTASDRNAVGVIGSMAKPNIDGFAHYAEGIFTASEIVVAGPMSAAMEKEYPSEKASYLGVLKNTGEFYRKIAVALAPIRFGGGLKIKCIEALTHNKAVFGTTHSLAGMPDGIDQVAIREDSVAQWNAERFAEAMAIDKQAIHDYCAAHFSDASCEAQLRGGLLG